MRYTVSLLMSLTLILTGCQSTQFALRDASSSLFDKQPSNIEQSCYNDEDVLNTLVPAFLYTKMNHCVRMHAYQQATFFFALAGSYTWYDAANADTYFARSQHKKLLADAFQAMPAAEREQTWSHIKSIMQDSTQHKALCQKVEQTGKPVYTPVYMLKNQTENKQQVQSFSWSEAIRQYLHCDDYIVKPGFNPGSLSGSNVEATMMGPGTENG